RNPWRFSFDRSNGDLYVGDVGQNRFEEIDFVVPATQPGANYGWRAYEGNARFSDEQIDESRLVRPILTYRLEGGACAVTGGNVYRGEVGSLGGFYLYADFCQGAVKGFRVQGSRAVDQKSFSSLRVPSIASFGEDSFGQTYVISLAGKVYRIVRQR
ncbi:MAG: PQQ-dependent sugar dehydrogenase, partial [Candidatus Methylomirabilales bacterium]